MQMTKSKVNALPIVIPGACFLAGVVLTLLWTSFSSSDSQAQESSVVFGNTTDASNISAKAWQTSKQLPSSHNPAQTGSLTRDDLLIALPSSLARSATTTHGTALALMSSWLGIQPRKDTSMHQFRQMHSKCMFRLPVCLWSLYAHTDVTQLFQPAYMPYVLVTTTLQLASPDE